MFINPTEFNFNGLNGYAIGILIVCLTISTIYIFWKKWYKKQSPPLIEPCPVVIDGKWYDLAIYLNNNEHPGGIKLIRQFQNKDCTEMFNTMHPNIIKDIRKHLLPLYIIPQKDVISNKLTIDNTDYYNKYNQKLQSNPLFIKILKLFEAKVKRIDFPCVCGKTSMYTKQVQYAIIDDINTNINDVALIFIEYMLNQQKKWKLKPKKYLTSLVIFFTNIEKKVNSRQEFDQYVLNLFDKLNKFEKQLMIDKSDIKTDKIDMKTDDNKLNDNMKSKIDKIDKDIKRYPLERSTFRFFKRTFFIATLNKYEKRAARNFQYPALIFNTVQEFDFIGDEFDIIHKIIAQRLRYYKL